MLEERCTGQSRLQFSLGMESASELASNTSKDTISFDIRSW